MLTEALIDWADILLLLYKLCVSNIVTATLIAGLVFGISIRAIGKINDLKK